MPCALNTGTKEVTITINGQDTNELCAGLIIK